MFFGMTYEQNNKLWIHISTDCYMRIDDKLYQPPELTYNSIKGNHPVQNISPCGSVWCVQGKARVDKTVMIEWIYAMYFNQETRKTAANQAIITGGCTQD